MKKILSTLAFVAVALVSAGCWNGEVGVETEFTSLKGAGTRTFVIDVMDDSLSTEPITNPDDPQKTEGKGAVLNDKYLDGGVEAIQGWLEDNAPSFVTVEPMKTEGYHRYFTLTYNFEDFEDFLTKYEELVNLSPTLKWDDFSAEEKPQWECEGASCTFTESKDLVEAAMDWAASGIYSDLIIEGDLAGFLDKSSIYVFANYTLSIGEEELALLQSYDPTAVDGEGTGKVVYVTQDVLTLSGDLPVDNTVLFIGIGVGVLAVGLVAFFVLRKKAVK